MRRSTHPDSGESVWRRRWALLRAFLRHLRWSDEFLFGVALVNAFFSALSGSWLGLALSFVVVLVTLRRILGSVASKGRK